MNKGEFRSILIGAVSGNHEDLEKILELYMPLIEKNSYLNGNIDEDLKQYLMIHITLQIGKFPL
ncbi:MAG: helix-turn-helix domain-containing protein [Eubacterium sp.]|jgi:hypothetical protein|nr:helix-turn-helix domain-containing protein [Eubacterium sp.]